MTAIPPAKFAVTDHVSAVLGDITHVDKSAVRRAHPNDGMTYRGYVVAELFGPDGVLKQREEGWNLVTDYGDEHVGQRMHDDTALIVTGMRLGTGITAASKAGAGAAIVTYITTSQEALDSVAAGADKGAGLGWRITHVCTWVAGDITNAAIAETVLTDETPITNVAGVVGNTVARFVFASTIDKQAGDSLVVTWQVDFLGA